MLFYHNVARNQIFKLMNKHDRHFSVKGRTDSISNTFSIIQTQKCVAAFTLHCAENQIDFFRFI